MSKCLSFLLIIHSIKGKYNNELTGFLLVDVLRFDTKQDTINARINILSYIPLTFLRGFTVEQSSGHLVRRVICRLRHLEKIVVMLYPRSEKDLLTSCYL